MAKGWQGVNNSQYGPVAALTDHPVLPIILIACNAQGVQMSVQLNQEYGLPDPGKPLKLTLQGFAQGDIFERVELQPQQAKGEYATFLSQKAMTLLAGRDESLALNISYDGGQSWTRDTEDIDLTGSSAAIKPVLAACNASAAPSADMNAEQVIRDAVEKYYAYYQDQSGQAAYPDDVLPFSRGVNALIDQTEMGALDYDPFCQCQDWDPNGFFYYIDSVSVKGERANVAIKVKAVGNMELAAITLKLIREGGKWVVDDVTDGGGSLRDYLQDQ